MDLKEYLKQIFAGLTTPQPTGAEGLRGLAEAYAFSPPQTGGPQLHSLLAILGMMGKLKNVGAIGRTQPALTRLTRVGNELMDMGSTGVVKNFPKTAEPITKRTDPIMEILKGIRK